MRRNATLVEVAFAVCTALDRAGIEAVLCGGSAATLYVPERHQSDDADFVLVSSAGAQGVRAVVERLGFVRRADGSFAHPNVRYTVEFPRGPLAIGRDLVTTWETRRRRAEVLHVLTPTDVVRDRFLSYWAWGDYSSLVTALAVAKAWRAAVDTAFLRVWIERERAADPVGYDAVRAARFLAALGAP